MLDPSHPDTDACTVGTAMVIRPCKFRDSTPPALQTVQYVTEGSGLALHPPEGYYWA